MTVAVQLLEGLAGESRSACARSCFLNVAVWEYVSAGLVGPARRLLSHMSRVGLLNLVSDRLLQKLSLSHTDLETGEALPSWPTGRAQQVK